MDNLKDRHHWAPWDREGPGDDDWWGGDKEQSTVDSRAVPAWTALGVFVPSVLKPTTASLVGRGGGERMGKGVLGNDGMFFSGGMMTIVARGIFLC